MTTLTAFYVLLHRYTGQEDITIGFPITGRNRQEIEGLMGPCVNTLVLRANLAGNPTFRELLAQVRDVTLQTYANQDLPFDRLVEACNQSAPSAIIRCFR
jgi:non-ribosomal peptide synthetase component F